jgi:hypothetical protein
MAITAITMPMAIDSRFFRDEGRSGLVVSDKDVNRHQNEECRQVRDGEMEQTHRLTDLGRVGQRVSVESRGVKREQTAQHRRR